ncbi:MAG: ABC transporter ATP-binding protein [Fimbriimonadaceae bacterium]|nr:ABC transporter ATP-binding protein [Chthonomonadaceae bacterium]MCO5295900.1 ABC transporter ATP-binding protein [Fimbriimonadaceae bacterium]
MPETPAIYAENLRVCYRTKRGARLEAVRGLSFRVEPGEVVGFLGPNGAGKSSTLKALMGFVPPSAGTCQVFGLPAGSREAKARTGYLPEVALYYPYLTPLETLVLYGELQGLRGRALRDEAAQLLDTLGLGAVGRKQNRHLSKGMLQRVGIAQALLGSPELLVLDEVTSGLDPVGRRELRAILRQKQAQGATLFFSSHELSEVEMLCDRILVIDRGALVEERPLGALREELRTFSLLTDGPIDLDGLDATGVDEAGALRVACRTKADLLEAAERVLRSGHRLLDLVAKDGSLEDYFVETIRRAA